MKMLPRIFCFALILTLTSISFFEFYELKCKDKTINKLNQNICNLENVIVDKDHTISELKTDNEVLSIAEAPKHPIEIAVQKCMKEKNYTTYGMSQCVDDSINDWDKEIDNSIKLFKKTQPKDKYILLMNSQQKWKEYRKVQTKLINNTIAEKQGTIYINITSGYNTGIVEDRARELSAIIHDLTNSGE